VISKQINKTNVGFSHNILIAEDNLVNPKVAEKMVMTLGHSCDLVSNGKEAIDKIFQSKQPYTIIMMDMQMPTLYGVEASKRIIGLHPKTHPIIIAMTANVLDEARDKCLQAGMDDFLTKPVNINELENTLNKNEPLIKILEK
jgi:CheY-like chemotaxis protein